jgi:insulysin
MREWVEEMFSSIQNKNLVRINSKSNPYPVLFQSQHLRKFFTIVPVRKLRDLVLFFPVPVSDDERAYLVKANRYWSHLLGHESEGSIFSLLKKKGWVNSLSAGQMSKFTGSFVFSVTLALTEEGMVDLTRKLIRHR